jgi:hypothetical protein
MFFMVFYIDSIPNEIVGLLAVMLKCTEVTGTGFLSSVVIYWVAEMLSVLCICCGIIVMFC